MHDKFAAISRNKASRKLANKETQIHPLLTINPEASIDFTAYKNCWSYSGFLIKMIFMG